MTHQRYEVVRGTPSQGGWVIVDREQGGYVADHISRGTYRFVYEESARGRADDLNSGGAPEPPVELFRDGTSQD